jgi:hypothetical protein
MTCSIRVLVLVAILGSAGVAFVGCATSAEETFPNVVDAGGAADAGTDGRDGGPAPCSREGGADECANYPDDCSADTLCNVDIELDRRVRLQGLWASGPNDVWTVGSLGTVLHYDGSAWRPITTGKLETFSAVWGTAADDVWVASSDSFAMHTRGLSADGGADFRTYRGESSSGLLVGLWGTKDAGIWGILDRPGSNGEFPIPLIVHSSGWDDGEGPRWVVDDSWPWVQWAPPSGHAIFGFDERNVWSGSVRGIVRRRIEGGDRNWQEVNSRSLQSIHSIWGSNPDDVWMVGSQSTLLHWDGRAITTVEVDPSLAGLSFLGVTGTGPHDLWIVGENALVVHYNGERFARVPVGGLGPGRPTLRKVWADTATDQVWIVGDGVLLGGKRGAVQ